MTNHHNKINWIRLSRSKNIGPITFFNLLKKFSNIENIINNAQHYLSEKYQKPFNLYPENLAIKELESCLKIGAQIITFDCDEYPKLLKEIADPPPIITTLGNTSLLNRKIISIVGPRNASINGCHFAQKIAHQLSESSIITASGMARGIDTSCHIGSLKGGTIAVIAGGIDNIYPKENTKLYHQIAKNGLIISENKFGSSPIASNFPRRNRIISGISLGTAIIEATLKSGTLITARCALEQNREIFAVPGYPLDPRCQGTNQLIKQGAKLLENVEDILNEIDHKHTPQQITSENILPIEPVIQTNDSEIKRAEKLILTKLNYAPIIEDELISILNIPINISNIAITQMQLNGKIQKVNGKISLKY